MLSLCHVLKSTVWKFQFLTKHLTLSIFCILILVFWYFHVDLISTYPMTNDTKYLVRCLFTVYMLFLVKYLFKSFALFYLNVLFNYFWEKRGKFFIVEIIKRNLVSFFWNFKEMYKDMVAINHLRVICQSNVHQLQVYIPYKHGTMLYNHDITIKFKKLANIYYYHLIVKPQ